MAHSSIHSQPPRKLLLHHRLILLAGGSMSQMGWIFIAIGSLFVTIFSTVFVATGFPEEADIAIIGIVIPLIFPIIGAIFVGIGLKRNFKTVDLLTNGKFAQGKVTGKQPTNTKINEQMVYEYTVTFKADNGREYEVKSKTHLYGRVGNEALEKVLYVPADPSWGMIFDTIPKPPKFGPNGEILPPHWSSLLMLFLPAMGLTFMALMLNTAYNLITYMT